MDPEAGNSILRLMPRFVFIRAPLVTASGQGIKIMSRIPQGIIAVESGRHMAFAFHPELGGDTRLHERFLKNLGI